MGVVFWDEESTLLVSNIEINDAICSALPPTSFFQETAVDDKRESPELPQEETAAQRILLRRNLPHDDHIFGTKTKIHRFLLRGLNHSYAAP